MSQKVTLDRKGRTFDLKPDVLVEGLKQLDAEEFSAFCIKACEDNLASRLIELLSIERMEKDNADYEMADRK